LTSFADAGAAALAAGIATQAPDGSYVFHAPGEAPGLPASGVAGPMVQRVDGGIGETWLNSVTNWWDQTFSGQSPTGGTPTPPTPTTPTSHPTQPTQPAPPPRPPDQTGPEQTQTAMQTGPIAAPANTSAPQQSELDLDVLAHRLYPKLRPYLRRELWIGRERGGHAIDRRSS
jgi:hypothetical protein